jgi:hypothetical protein
MNQRAAIIDGKQSRISALFPGDRWFSVRRPASVLNKTSAFTGKTGRADPESASRVPLAT